MKLVLQRVLSASVAVENEKISSIEKGYLILLGVENDDSISDCSVLASKVSGLRIFEDENEKMNLSIKDISGDILVVSNFTICADCRKGRRPSFSNAKSPKEANFLYEEFCKCLKQQGVNNIQKGTFGADMKVGLTNDGPVTIILDSKELKGKC